MEIPSQKQAFSVKCGLKFRKIWILIPWFVNIMRGNNKHSKAGVMRIRTIIPHGEGLSAANNKPHPSLPKGSSPLNTLKHSK